MKRMSGRNFFATLFCVLVVLVCITANFAQDLDNVSISGKITDSNNAPIVGATITATLTATGVSRNVVTNEDGLYRMISLSPGTYTIKISASNFGIKEQKDLNTVAGQNVQLNVSLSPANVTAEQTITIDETPVVDTTRTLVGGTISSTEIEEIPNNSRNGKSRRRPHQSSGRGKSRAGAQE